jgi:hypothetical protein
MYTQVTHIHVPLNQMSQFRQVIENKYLPVVRARPGFLAGYLLEQVDDPDCAQLILFWDDHAAVENFHRTGLLQASITILASEIPGIQVHRESYLVKVAMKAARPEAVT